MIKILNARNNICNLLRFNGGCDTILQMGKSPQKKKKKCYTNKKLTYSDAFDWLNKQWVTTPSNLFNMPHLVVSTRTWSDTIQFFLPSGFWATANKTLSESFLNSNSNPFSSTRFASLSSRSSPLLVNPILDNHMYYIKDAAQSKSKLVSNCFLILLHGASPQSHKTIHHHYCWMFQCVTL